MKRALILLVALVATLGIGTQVLSEPLPQARGGAEAEALAHAVQGAVNLTAWEGTGAVTWIFRGKNTHLWDRARNLDKVEWGGDTKVLVDLGKQVGRAFVKGEEIHGADKDALVEKAYQAWINDSFWLNPVAKFYDEGVSRGVVTWEGADALLISYSSGGVTPGDSYLYVLGEDGRPKAWHMWVSIIPIKGVGVSWGGWTQLETGAWISTEHAMGPAQIDLTEVKGAASLEALVTAMGGGASDPFLPLFQEATP